MKTAAVLVAWIASTVMGFWWYDGRYRLPVPAKAPEKPSMAASLAVKGARVTLLSFYNPDCGCSRFAESHVASLAKRFGDQGLRIVTVVEGTGDAPVYDRRVEDPSGRIARALGIPAAPGAVVVDEAGKVAYTGGFNVARFCDDAKTAYAEQAIVAVLARHPITKPKGSFYGCVNVPNG